MGMGQTTELTQKRMLSCQRPELAYRLADLMVKDLRYLAAFMICTSGPVMAAEWSNSASITPGITYTDNVCLSESDTKDEWIGTVTPAGSITGRGARANVSLSGSVEFNSLSDSDLRDLGCTGGEFGNRGQFAPDVRGSADAILVEQWLFIDAAASATQNTVTPFASGGSDPFDRTGNTNTTYDYAVSPYVQRRFGDTAELILRYTWDDQYNTSDVIQDSSQESVEASLSSVPGVARFSWGVQGSYVETKYDENDFDSQLNNQSELRSAQINVGYQLNRPWQLNGFYGREWNDFVSSQDEIDGSFWDVGFRWTPSARTIVEAGIGERFFGTNPRFLLEQRHKRYTFSAIYAKTLTYDRDIRTQSNIPPLNPDFPPAPDLGQGITTVSTSPILDERFSLALSFQGRLTRWSASAYQSDQTREDGGVILGFTEAVYRGVSLSLSREVSSQINVSSTLSWSEEEPKDDADDSGQIFQSSETWAGSVRVSRSLSQRTSLGLAYQYTDRQSDSFFNSYTENRVTLDLSIEL